MQKYQLHHVNYQQLYYILLPPYPRLLMQFNQKKNLEH